MARLWYISTLQFDPTSSITLLSFSSIGESKFHTSMRWQTWVVGDPANVACRTDRSTAVRREWYIGQIPVHSPALREFEVFSQLAHLLEVSIMSVAGSEYIMGNFTFMIFLGSSRSSEAQGRLQISFLFTISLLAIYRRPPNHSSESH